MCAWITGPEMRLGFVHKENQEWYLPLILQSACLSESEIGIVMAPNPGNSEVIGWLPQSYNSPTETNKTLDDVKTSTEAMDFAINAEVEQDYSAADYVPHPITGFSDDVKSWLARPFSVFSGTWSTASNLGDNIFSYQLAAIFGSNLMLINKLKGYKYIKCTHVIKLELNPTPFHAGCFQLQWHPFPAAEIATHMHRTPISASQLPNVTVTTADNSAQIKVPWIYPEHAYNLTYPSTCYNWGSVVGKVYSPLATGTGSTTIGLNMFQWLEDVELFGIAPQSSRSKSINLPKKVIPSDKEKNNGEGPITRAFGLGEQVASSLASIPLFAPVCKPASWVFNTAARVSSLFGWSKPSLGEGGKNSLVTVTSDAYNNNANGTDNTFVITPSVDFSTTPSKMLTINNEDEMSIEFIATRWSYLTHFSFPASANINDNLWATDLNLSIFSLSQSVELAVGQNFHAYSMTPLCYLANIYKFWRGDIEFKFVFVKTGYHSGQIKVNYTNLPGPMDYQQELYAARELIDLQSGDEVIFRCPYISNQPYTLWDQSIGTIELDAATTIKAPSTVSSGIDVLVFVRGSPGFDFQGPSGTPPLPVFAPQGRDVEEENAMGNTPDIGGIAIRDRTLDIMSQWTIGDNQESILALIKRFSHMNFDSNFASIDPTIAAGAGLQFSPQLVEAPFLTPTVDVRTTITPLCTDHVARFSWLYLFRRGGIKIRVKNIGDKDVVYRYDIASVPQTMGVYTNLYPDTRSSINDYRPERQNVSSAIEIPQYGTRFGGMQTSSVVEKALASGAYISITWPTGTKLEGKYLNNTSMLYRAASDDFHFSFFLGIPTVMTSFVLYLT